MCRRNDLDANRVGVVLCNLGANGDGAKPSLFFESIPLGAYLRESFEKMAKNKKDGVCGGGREVQFPVDQTAKEVKKK
jgi:hypothetical protein